MTKAAHEPHERRPVIFWAISVLFFSWQHREESQLKRTRGDSHSQRFGGVQGQPNSHRIHGQQLQWQKERQVNVPFKPVLPLLTGSLFCVPVLDLSSRERATLIMWHCKKKIIGPPGGRMRNDSCLFTSIYFAANRGSQCSTQVRCVW